MTPDGKYIYNLLSSPPQTTGKCDITGLDLIQRDDDKVEVVSKRVKIFEDETFPMLAHYKGSKFYHEINAELPVDMVSSEISRIILAKY
jgi:adenylate kinase